GRAARGGALAGAEATTAMRPQIGPSRLSRTCRAFAAEVAVADSRATQQRTCHVLNHGTSIPPRRRVRDRAELPRGARQSDLFTLTLRSPSTYPIQGRFTHGSKAARLLLRDADRLEVELLPYALELPERSGTHRGDHQGVGQDQLDAGARAVQRHGTQRWLRGGGDRHPGARDLRRRFRRRPVRRGPVHRPAAVAELQLQRRLAQLQLGVNGTIALTGATGFLGRFLWGGLPAPGARL